MSELFHKIRNALETVLIYVVGLPIGFAYWVWERQMRKLLGDDWLSRGEPSGHWPMNSEENDGQ